MSLFSTASADSLGRTSWECIVGAASRLMRDGKYGGKAYASPEMFQIVQDELVAHRDPTLRAEWDGNRCYLRVAICGRELTIHMREDLAHTEFELTEVPVVRREERF